MQHYYLKDGNIKEMNVLDIREVKELVELIDSSELAYFELKIDGNYLKMDKSLTRSVADKVLNNEEKVDVENVKDKTASQVLDKKVDNIVVEKEDENITVIKAPMVGTFYSSPSPEKESFVKKGDTVHRGKTLCIIEAMKLMNEIECENNCEIIDVLVNDGDMVEYGQALFSVKFV